MSCIQKYQLNFTVLQREGGEFKHNVSLTDYKILTTA